MTPTMTIEERIEKLERSLRRWQSGARILGALLVIFLTILFVNVVNPPIRDVVQGRRLEVVDATGKPQVILGSGFFNDAEQGAGGGYVKVEGYDGHTAINIGAGRGRPRNSVTIYTRSGKSAIALDVEKTGGQVVTFDGQDNATSALPP